MISRTGILALFLLAMPLAAQGGAGEYQVKAAFLFNFAKFVEWPDGSFKSPTDGIHICVLGDNPFGTALSDVLAGKKVNDRPLVGVRILEVKLRAILAATGPAGILTVGDSDNFALDGGVIGFRVEDGRVRLEINLKAAENAQVQISSKLLSLAQIVKK